MEESPTVSTSGWEMDCRPVDVVSISSQLAYGTVGNNATSRIFAARGQRAALVPTVLMGALPHYSGVDAHAVPDTWLSGMLDDMLRLGALDEVTCVLVGFLATPRQAVIISEWFMRLRERRPSVHLVVDPAMGDDDVGLYADPAVADAYRTVLVPLATGVTPNRFELDILVPGADSSPAVAAERIRTEEGWAVVTSAGRDDHLGTVEDVVVSRSGVSTYRNFQVRSRAKGAGDVFVATVVSELIGGADIEAAAERASEQVRTLLQDPHALL